MDVANSDVTTIVVGFFLFFSCSVDSLVNSSGHILIPGIYDAVAVFTDEEKKLYEPIEFDLEEHKANIGVKKFLYDTKVRWSEVMM